MSSAFRALARVTAVASFILLVCCQGQELWSWQAGTGEDDYIRAAAVDTKGDFVLAGETAGVWGSPQSAGGADFIAVKLDGDTGEEVWAWQGGTSLQDSVGVVAVDAEDNVFIAGGTTSDDGESVFAVVKLDGGTGLEKWRSINGTEGSDLISAAAVDTSGDIVIAGSTSGSLENWLAVKLSGATGAALWRRQWSNPEPGEASVVTIDADGNPLLVGKQGGQLEAVKLDGGTGVVVSSWQAAADGWDAVTIAGGQADASGNILLGGTTTGNWVGDNSGLSDFMALKLDGTTGREAWRWQGGTNENDKVSAAVVDPSGDLILAGWTLGSWARLNLQEGDEPDFMCVKLDGNTGEELVRWQGGSTTYRDSASTAAVDTAGDIVLAGWTNGDWGTLQISSEHDPDFVAVKVAASLATPSPQPLQTSPPSITVAGPPADVAGGIVGVIASIDEDVGNKATATPASAATLGPESAPTAISPAPTMDVATTPTATPAVETLAPNAEPAAAVTPTPTAPSSSTTTSVPSAAQTPAPTTATPTSIETPSPTSAHLAGSPSRSSSRTRSPVSAPTVPPSSDGAILDSASSPSLVGSPTDRGGDDGGVGVQAKGTDGIGESGIVLGAIVIGALAGCLILTAVLGAGYRRLTTNDDDDDSDDEFSHNRGKANPKVRDRPGALRSKI